MNEPIHLGFSIQELTKILMYDFWYDYAKLKYDKKAKLCFMDTDSFIVFIKTSDIYKGIFDTYIYLILMYIYRFDTLNYELDRPLTKGKNEKVIRLMKDDLGEKIMTKFVKSINLQLLNK